MRNKSVVSEGNEIQVATALVKLGARLQVLETETSLSRERLLKLYKEIKGVSPPKGMLPFSADWYLSWQPNVHSSMFIDIHNYLLAHTDARGPQALIRSYSLYLEHAQACGLEPILTLTRAWTLLRFYGKLLRSVVCTRCGGSFIGDTVRSKRNYVCGLCRPPSRAGTSAKRPADVARAAAVKHDEEPAVSERFQWPPPFTTLNVPMPC